MNKKEIKLFLARHGNTFDALDKVVMVGCKTDLPLTQKGHEQALALATYFKNDNINFNKVYCGHLKRQRETAQAISKKVITGIKALDELDYGPWEGLTDEEIQKKWPLEFANWNEKGIWPTHIFGHSFEEKKQDIEKWIQELKKEPCDSILAISSGGIIRLFLSLMPSLWKNIHFKDYKVKTGHFCELLINEQGLKVLRWNQAPFEKIID